MDAITVIFVVSKDLKDETETGEIMMQAFEACQQNKVKTIWMKEQDIHKKELKKTDFIVFESFEGNDFENIKKAKSVSILGPWCILVCLMEGKKIPNFEWPIYNVAMYDCIVTSSHLPKTVKMDISEKVQKMGGYYSDSLAENSTHLITDSVKSAKYMKAIEMGIKVLTPSWVDAVWQASQEANVHCNDKVFEKYKCPPLHKLIISTTGIKSLEEREAVRAMINENGGKYSGKLNLKITDFLICDGTAGAMSEKYKEARKTENVTCVTLHWLHDSIEKGYCVPHHDYVVKKSTSTPKRNDLSDPNFSTMSAINQSKCDKSSIDETLVKKPNAGNSCTPPSNVKKRVFAECDSLIQNIDLKKAKRSGYFLDGCSVYLVGFKDDHREKICRILNVSGATRCDEISDRVTHILVGDPECSELKLIKSRGLSCSIVTLQWLLDSIERQRPCLEESYLVSNLRDEPYFKSPSGKKGLSLLRSNRTITEIDLTLSQKEKEILEEDDAAEREIMEQYMMPEPVNEEDTLAHLLKNYDSEVMVAHKSESQTKSEGTSTLQNEEGSQTITQSIDIFRGLTFFITNFDEEQAAELQEQIQGGLGCIASDLEEANYIVSPCFITQPLSYNEDCTINDLWIYESITEEELVPVKYYHRPLLICNPSVLEDCVVTISGYSGYERNFLSSLIVMLGGVSQEQFCRVTSVQRNVLGSTHLVTAEATGKKYAGAIKWSLPAVDKDWLIGCSRSQTKLPEQNYLVSRNSSRIENTTEKNPSLSLEDLKITGNAIVPSHLIEFKKDYYNFALGITANSDPSMKENSRNSHDADRDCLELNADLLEKLNGKQVNAKESSVQEISEPIRNVERIVSRVQNFSAEVETATAPTEDSFTIPPPRKLSMGRRECKSPKPKGDPFKTPDGKDDDVFYSQVTPVDKIMSAVRMTNLLGTPDSPQLPKLPWDVDTPETPYGLCFTPNPSKSLKKALLRCINRFPDNPTPVARRRLSTPLSELKRKLWDKIGSGRFNDSYEEENETPQKIESQEEDESEKQTTSQTELVNTKLEQLENIMAASESAKKSRRQSKTTTASLEPASEVHIRQSQPCTVQWDYGKDTQEEPPQQSRIFMISGVGDLCVKERIITSLKELGGIVSETSSYDRSATHLLCPKPARNEKTLSSMAAGKWILHVEYVNACMTAGKFLNEEDYEFGNPNSFGKISIELDRDIELRMQAIYYWRNEIARTGKRPFQDMIAIIVAEKKQALISVIEAGGGTVIDAEPPFKNDVLATHCLMEPKSVTSFSLYEPLARQGIYCVNTVYLSDFLHRTNNDIKDAILPFFQKHFS